MKNKLGIFNLANYLKDLNNIPSDRFVDNSKFNGRISLKDSFEYYSKKDFNEDSLQLNLIDGIYHCAINRKVGYYDC